MPTPNQELDPVFAVQRPLSPTVPVGPAELDHLFLLLIKYPAFYAEVRDLLDPRYFDPFTEAPFQLLWTAIQALYAAYGSCNIQSLFVYTDQLVRANPTVLTQEQVGQLLGQPDGIIATMGAVPDTQINTPDAMGQARATLQRLLYERTVVRPLQQLANPRFLQEGAWAENFTDYLTAFATRAARLSTMEQLPVVDLAPPPGRQLGPSIALRPTGVNFIDTVFGGQVVGDANGILGVTGSGKTTMATYMAVRMARHSYGAGNENCDQVAFFTWEESMAKIRPRLLAAGCYLQRARLEGLTDFNQLLRTPADYDRHLTHLGNHVGTEYTRYLDGSQWIRQALVGFDFSGSEEFPAAGQGGVAEIVSVLDRHVQRTGRGICSVLIDYAGLCCRRYMMAKNMDDSRLRHLIREFGDDVRRQIAERFHCTAWILHQIRADAGSSKPTKLLHHTDAAEGKAFAEHLALCGCIGVPDPRTGLRMLNWSKTRRVAEQHVQPIGFRIDENFATIQVAEGLVRSPDGQSFVNANDAAHIHGAAEQQQRPGQPPHGLRRGDAPDNANALPVEPCPEAGP